MAALAVNGDLETVAGGGHVAGTAAVGTDVPVQHNVHGGSSINLGVLQNTGLDHGGGALELLFGRLEHQLDGTAQFVFLLLQHLCSAQQHSGMHIMAAVVGIAGLGVEGQVIDFGHGQCVHVCAQQVGLAGLLAFDHGDNTALADLLGFQTDLGQALHDVLGCLGQFVADFRMHMQIMSVVQQRILQFFGTLHKMIHANPPLYKIL